MTGYEHYKTGKRRRFPVSVFTTSRQGFSRYLVPAELAKIAAVASLSLITCAEVRAQTPRIWDIVPGMHVSALPSKTFVDPSCGTRGGPQGKPLGQFDQFRNCPAEPGGLREVWFSYDDTAEFVALARRQSGQRRTTSVLDQPVILSVLLDPNGFVDGYRIYTDTRAEHDLRLHAHEVAIHFKARFSLDGYCEDQPAANRETPIDGQFVKELCVKETGDRIITSEAKFYYRPGQQFYDPNSLMPMTNSFESSARLEVLQVRKADERQPLAPPPAPATTYIDARAAFLAGASRDCAACNLFEADLRYRDLSGADLSEANLQGALLHKANLRNANLSRANLDGANLNRANLSFADFTNASLVNAMLYQADAARADFSSANVSRAILGKLNAGFAKFAGASLDNADLGEARLNDTDLTGASLKSAFLPLASLLRAKLQRALGPGANMAGARLRNADLSDSDLRGADLSHADLASAEMRNADLGGARLVSADLSNANMEGANLKNARMPDNSTRQ